MGNGYSRAALPMEQGIIVSGSGETSYSRSRKRAPEKVQQVDAALPESVFHSMLTLEHRRMQRSGKTFVLMLIDANRATGILKRVAEITSLAKRETDLLGWYKEHAILGIVFTGVNLKGDSSITETLRVKIETALVRKLGREKAAKVAISLHVLPEAEGKDLRGWEADSKLCIDF